MPSINSLFSVMHKLYIGKMAYFFIKPTCLNAQLQGNSHSVIPFKCINILH